MNDYEMMNGTLDDLVFEDRNKEYGAYMLRKEYAKNQLAAFFLSMLVFLVLIVIAYWPKQAMAADKIVMHKEVHTVLTPPPPLPKSPKPLEMKIPAPPKIKYMAPKVTTSVVPADKKMPDMEDIMKAPVISNDGPNHLPDFGGTQVIGEPVEIHDKTQPKKPKIRDFVSEAPRFPGGEAALYSYLKSHINYPEMARELGIQGKVYLTFVVAADGHIIDVNLKRGVDKTLNKEAERVIKGMPNWIPGKDNGKPVYVRCSLPIEFKVK